MSGDRARGRNLRLDGIRGVAVLLVLLYHAQTPGHLFPADARLLPGGWIGVDVFFVLSGYLITSLLLAEREETGTIARRAFYGRRVRRLLPALAALLGVWLLLTLDGRLPVEKLGATGHAGRGLALVPLAGAFSLVYNWVLALDLPTPQGMGHLWSLSVEEQFYLVWPSVLLFATARGRRPQRLLVPLLFAAAGFSLLLSISAVQGGERDFAYFSSPTAALGLLVGAATALVRPPLVGRAVGGLAVATLAACAVLVADTNHPLLPWVVLATSVATATLIAGGGGPIDRALEARWLRYAGRRSYAVYLWSSPLSYATLVWGGRTWGMVALTLGGSFLLAELSWRLVERRFLARRPRRRAPVVLDPRPESA